MEENKNILPVEERKKQLDRERERLTEPVVAKRPVKKRGALTKAADAIFTDDTQNIADYIVWDVLVPGIKNAVADMVIGGIQMALFGETKASGRHNIPTSSVRTRGGNREYDSCYDDDRRSRRSRRDRERRRDEYNDIELTRSEAEKAVLRMEELVKKYDDATVADLNRILGLSNSSHTDTKWGWDDCRDFGYRPSGRYYVLDFAEPKYLD